VFFAWDIKITKNTAETSPKTQHLRLTRGIITQIAVKFPAGCHGLVKVRLFHQEFQLLPLNPDEWLTGDDETVIATYYYKLQEPPIGLKFHGASPGTSYDHTVTVRVTVLPEKVASMLPLVEMLTKLFRRIGLI